MDMKSNAKYLIDSFASQLLYYTSPLYPVWLGREHKYRYDFILKGSNLDPALLMPCVGIITVSLHWRGELVLLREAFCRTGP